MIGSLCLNSVGNLKLFELTRGSAMTSVCIISGSPSLNGATGQVIKKVTELLQEKDFSSDIIHIPSHDVKPCGRCGDCNSRKTPCQTNDDCHEIMQRMISADGIIYAVPVHAFGMAHPMQIFMERMGVGHLRFTRPLANKPAGAIVVGRRYNHMGVYNQILDNILLNRMIVVGSGYPPIVHAGRPYEVEQDSEGIEAVLSMVERLTDFIRFQDWVHTMKVASPQLDLLPLRSFNERESRLKISVDRYQG